MGSRLGRQLLLVAVVVGGVFGCTSPRERVRARRHALEAVCDVPLADVGTKAMEDDYLPHVVACENGDADAAALRAQAIAARSYAVYKIDEAGVLIDGQGDQVYSCRRSPGPEHYAAVAATAGQILRYQATVVAGFYVAGAIPTAASCVAQPADEDPYDTEQFVTYNEGKSGTDVEQTSLGWINPGNHANRGCMSQNGADCLSEAGSSHEQILRFYYGADIELLQTVGPCVVVPADDQGTAPADGSAADSAGDHGVDLPARDSGGNVDARPSVDAGARPREDGGCNLGGTPTVPCGVELVLLLWLARRRR